MERYFCLATDKNYLAKAITMIDSLKRWYGNSAKFYYFCFDNETYDVLSENPFPEVIPISLSEFEDDELREIKETRSTAEYFFTCTPSFVLFCLKKYNLPMCTYLDSDLYFFSSPEPLFKEMESAGRSAMIIEHRFSNKYLSNIYAGKYCVQFMPFKNNEKGFEILNWWRNACNGWCYHSAEDGKWADQGYLNDWPVRFPSVHDLKHLGGGVAPWNIDSYEIIKKDNEIFIIEKETGDKHEIPLIFFHFQGVRFVMRRLYYIGYKLDRIKFTSIYKPYINSLLKTAGNLRSLDHRSDFLGINKKISFKDWLKAFYRLLFKDGYLKI